MTPADREEAAARRALEAAALGFKCALRLKYGYFNAGAGFGKLRLAPGVPTHEQAIKDFEAAMSSLDPAQFRTAESKNTPDRQPRSD